jgi:putative methyltransferase (TIGR04325 family)
MIKYFKNFLISFFNYGISFKGKFNSWEKAKQNSIGYENDNILKNIISSANKVKRGEYAFERDSILFKNKEYSPIFLLLFILINEKKYKKINYLDFGGSLGSKYFQYIDLLKKNNFKWNVVEQKKFVQIGKEDFSNNNLNFYASIKECQNNNNKIDVVYTSCVLQYVENPTEILKQLLSLKPDFLLFERVYFSSSPDYITIQNVPSKIYKSSYPCWIFNRSDFIETIKINNYSLYQEFKSGIDIFNSNFESKSMIFIPNE